MFAPMLLLLLRGEHELALALRPFLWEWARVYHIGKGVAGIGKKSRRGGGRGGRGGPPENKEGGGTCRYLSAYYYSVQHVLVSGSVCLGLCVS